MPYSPLSRVLSVDDDLDACEMLKLLLKSRHIDVTCVQSAAEALAKIETASFDLYLLDAWLPGCDGFQLCRQIRAGDATTPILFYSGAAYEADKQQGIAAGANAYVTKPDVDGLIRTMMDLIAKARAADVVTPFVNHQRQPSEKRFSSQYLSLKAASS